MIEVQGGEVPATMHLVRVKSLLDFLRLGDPTLESILKFVALDTLYDFSAITLFLNIVRRDGSVYIPAGYGYNEEALALIPERLVSAETPINRSLRTGVIVECGNSDDFLFSGAGYSEKLHPGGFAYSVAWPIPGVGSVVTFCSKEVTLSVVDEEFLLVLGEILAMEIVRVLRDVDLGRSNSVKTRPTNFALTPRQWTILLAIQKGRTNAEIATELGFSESLVRQETVQIYRKLGVSGRREILDSPERFIGPRSNDAIDPVI